MSDGSQENLSKRERQKQRREARKEAERNAAKRARLTRLAVFALLGLAVAGGVGYLVQQALAGRAEREEAIEEGQELASEFGCTEVEQPESLGTDHLPLAPQQLADNPPDELYDHRPTTSGTHLSPPGWMQTGVYDSYVDERSTTHNLEHGYVVMWYAEDAPDDQVEALKTFAQERVDQGDQEIVAAQYNAEMDDGANFAFTAWGNRQLCEEFDDRVALAFVDEFHNASGVPEPNAGPHLGENQGGGIDPETQQAVFPPLDETSGDPGPEAGGDQSDDGGTAEEGGEGTAGNGEGGADAGGEEAGGGEGGDTEGDGGGEDDGG